MNLGKGISDSSHLKKIEMLFSKDYFEGGSQEVCTALSKCKAKQITLEFNDTYNEEDNNFNLIGQELSKNQYIQDLSLEFQSYKIDSEVTQSFCQELLKFNLFSLGLWFYYNNLTEENMMIICMEIQKIKSLNTLKFKYEEKERLQINFNQFLKRKFKRLVNFN
ncbi:hypothetical protein TTHERM_00784740 (macronuclear) [Tetrahymena thermophila SB210]|uniref:Kinase domain protein n=1 Tax=Tetrahymena thermophila (strain SB210) TaxID=312017 RepID=Q231L5_TETTS|nr:hypothetical protein TTHERM_00784740 [Tetrahymena thermophila SB210]EAR91287.2 hypothetical protein TTHERM_00784740 [Tetrahymena thermophila SB210]|eukprot:XP_001011532.2 hypothetical protein TTHERM_00784740 [Tetrahymena thermophila SB210]